MTPPTENDDALSPSGDGDQESDYDFQTPTLDTLVAPPTENDDALSSPSNLSDLPSGDGDQESDFEFQTPTQDTPVALTTPKMTGAANAPESTELMRNA